MPTVVGVRLRFSKTLWFDPAGATPVEGEQVVVQTERGEDLGRVVQEPHEVTDAQLPAELKPVLRVANEEDLSYAEELRTKEAEAMKVYRRMVAEHKLDMKPIDVEYLFGGDKIIFYFSSEERVDFRDLVRDLATEFHARIDMRQVGVRDEARAIGGIGHCGQPLCCVRFGGEFQPVSIRMAKEQDLPLNPLKISGLCGRLMCCLRYEFDAYKDYKGRAPKRGALIDTPIGLAKVTNLDTPREAVGLRFEDGKSIAVPLASLGCSKGTGCPCSLSAEALEEITGTSPVVEAPMPAPEPRPKPENRPRRERPKGEPKAKGEPKPKADGAEKAPAAEGEAATEGTSRRRRRRRGGGGGGGEAQAAPAAQAAQPKQDQPAQPQGEGGKPRRRRRRRGGGGAGGGTTSE